MSKEIDDREGKELTTVKTGVEMIVTVGGPPGSGTTTISKLIAKRYGLKHVCAGFIFREMAKKMNMDLSEFSRYAEEHPEIDREIDTMQVEIAKEGNVVLEGRLTAWILRRYNIQPTLSIWLKAPPEVRCERVSKRENKDMEISLSEMMDREKSEKKRYRDIYNIDIEDLSIYHLVIDTSLWDVDGVFNIVCMSIDSLKKR